MPLSSDEQRRIDRISERVKRAEEAHRYLFQQPHPGHPSRAERLDDFLANRQTARRVGRFLVRSGAAITTLVVAFEAIKRAAPWLIP